MYFILIFAALALTLRTYYVNGAICDCKVRPYSKKDQDTYTTHVEHVSLDFLDPPSGD